ncbi:uncharacterized protein [Gossypium hirsutum]|uniref:Uncharacterized protein n=1 Tax=Gossypium hirsutum TaxID=3635 RepID=A0A1U8IS91_GOSHI|nr:uncharacterized protein LOC107898286 [Gossypium hirsutum]
MNYEVAGKKRLLDFTKLEEIRRNAYENAVIYKEKTKQWLDKIIIQRQFIAGQQVLLFNSRIKLHPGKLRSRYSGPFEVLYVFPHGAVTIRDLSDGHQFKVNGQRLKHYFGNSDQK